MTPETQATAGASTGERRRAVAPTAAWDPHGPVAPAIAPALWSTLRDAVESVQRDWHKVVEDAASPDEAVAHLACVATALRGVLSGDEECMADLPRTVLSRCLVAMVRS